MGGIIPKELKLRYPQYFSININLNEDSEYGKMLAEKYGKKKMEENINIMTTPDDTANIVSNVVKNDTVNENNKKEIVAPFTMGDYIFDSDGSVRLKNSSISDETKDLVSSDKLALSKIIINNPIIKELIPNLKPEDIVISQHMLLMKIKRKDEEEIYRIDIIDDNIFIQAPFESPYIYNYEEFNFIAVPINSDLGRKVIGTKNYKIKVDDDFVTKECIFRKYQNAA